MYYKSATSLRLVYTFIKKTWWLCFQFSSQNYMHAGPPNSVCNSIISWNKII